MKFLLHVALGNDAMQGEGDVAHLLRDVATKLQSGRIEFVSGDGSFPSGVLRDLNGNKVGEWEVTE